MPVIIVIVGVDHRHLRRHTCVGLFQMIRLIMKYLKIITIMRISYEALSSVLLVANYNELCLLDPNQGITCVFCFLLSLPSPRLLVFSFLFLFSSSFPLYSLFFPSLFCLPSFLSFYRTSLSMPFFSLVTVGLSFLFIF